MLRAKRHNEEQLVKDLAECLTHGVINVRHAGFVADLRANRTRKERILTGELAGLRILQAVAVGPTGSYMQEKTPALMKGKGDADRVPFSGADAVKFATIHSARSHGLAEEFGSIEAGKTADLVILMEVKRERMASHRKRGVGADHP
jgi:hypothetical protein